MPIDNQLIGKNRYGQQMTFVIPIVHPSGNKISDYGVVERILAETLTSLTFAEGDASVVVVCHKLPDWHERCSDRVTFLSLGDHWGFAAGRNDVRVDKGMKYCVGIWFALMDHAPDLIVPFDGDDFVRRDFVRSTVTQLEGLPNKDGLLIEGGYNAALTPRAPGFSLMAALKVRNFDLTCGSCRVLRAAKLRTEILKMSSQMAAFGRFDIADEACTFRGAFLDTFVSDADRNAEDTAGLVQVLGRHLGQEVFFDLAACTRDIVAKGCGHGNHDGPRAGEVHWDKLKGVTPNRRFMRLFGLDGRETMKSEPKASYQLEGVKGIAKHNYRNFKGLVKRLILPSRH